MKSVNNRKKSSWEGEKLPTKTFGLDPVDEALRYPEPCWLRTTRKIRIMISQVYLSNSPHRLKGRRGLCSVKYTDHSEGREKQTKNYSVIKSQWYGAIWLKTKQPSSLFRVGEHKGPFLRSNKDVMVQRARML